jgi:hypothetical protein
MIRILAALTVLTLVMPQTSVASNDSSPASVGYENAVVGYLRPALKYVGGSARMYYAGECRAAEYDTSGHLQLLFPAVHLQSPPPTATGMDAVSQIFRDDPNVTVMQDRSGMVRITIGSASTAVLQTKIRALNLDSAEQYTPQLAVLPAILGAPEVYAAERRLNVFLNNGIIDIVSGPREGAPHLPNIMHDVTVDQALDSVARTFKGIVTYGICRLPDGKNLFELYYIYGS